ncbi:SDR family oxidoreductase [Streptomyces sp. MNU77]|uniref:SDR family NAD(P)-dependent oxidoreductase n=1 Tax=Streptomyces sp. MNU77 TaxID=1573406 RepID=UPI0006988F0F|nr:SDR family NAD(P)-dependent oxidoreductase [Streptomyces sp. MNU77]OLO25766.1 SDR family oxidoreductase [Streptomyces sp. MNU77]
MHITGTVAVTGAGSGLGRALAAEWARRGAHVLALVHEEEQRPALEAALDGLPGRADIRILDVTAPGGFAFPDDVEVLVNNAGIRLRNLPVEEIPTEEWRRHMEVNFFGAVELTRRALPLMRARRRGVIVNINSNALTMPLPFLGPYRSSKGALAAFAETLRTEVSPFGIRVLEILSGSVRTGLSATAMSAHPPEAVDVPAYAPMARHIAGGALLGGGVTAEPLPAEVAAERVVDAVLREDGRFRYGTDERSTRSIDAWRGEGGGEPLIARYIEAVTPPAG